MIWLPPTTQPDTPDFPPGTLGHGGHWAALGVAKDEIADFVRTLIRRTQRFARFHRPWRRGQFRYLEMGELLYGALRFLLIIGRCHPEDRWTLLSAFPAPRLTQRWVVQVERATSAYGPYEGVIKANGAMGHPLGWFAPRFGFEAKVWRELKGTPVSVALTALALEIRPLDAHSFTVKSQGQVQAINPNPAGKSPPTTAPTTSITYSFTTMRTIFTTQQDEPFFFGRLHEVRPIQPCPSLKGWRVTLQCLPPGLPTGNQLPMCIFPPALAPGYTPKRGDLVEGTAWLLGALPRPATAEEIVAWEQGQAF